MKRTFIVIAVLIIIIFSAAFKTDPPKYKNLKILPKNISRHELDSVMHLYSLSLGVKCGFCHVHNEEKKTWDMASDDKPEKLIARKMMLMTNDINKKFFPPETNQQAIQTITCYTCHKGKEQPDNSLEIKTDSAKIVANPWSPKNK